MKVEDNSKKFCKGLQFYQKNTSTVQVVDFVLSFTLNLYGYIQAAISVVSLRLAYIV